MSASATYVFAITRPDPAPMLDDIQGIDDARVRAVAEGGLAAIACDVSLDEFGEQPLQENLEKLDWLEKTARVHDLVVRLVAQQVTTAPLRMATIYRDDGAVCELLRGIAGPATEVLTRLDGRDEWGVKLYAVQESAEPEPERSGSGADYLRRRRSALTSRQDSAQHAAEDAARIYAQLSEASADARAHRPQDPQLSGIAAPMLLNGAFLVDRSAAEDFSRTVKELADTHPNLRFTLTGPWPPYSFAALDGES
jgi:predicted nucleic acid-binding protein